MAQIATRFPKIAGWIKKELCDHLKLPGERILWVAKRSVDLKTLADCDLLLRVGNATVGNGYGQNPAVPAGRYDTEARRTLQVTYRTRGRTDSPPSDENWLFDPDKGAVVLEEKIIDILHDRIPLDRDGNALTVGAMHWLGVADPAKEGKALEWGDGTVSFEIVYQLDLDTSLT